MTYAYPEELLRPLLPPELELDGYAGCAFLAIALVQTERLRPCGVPRALGCDFFLSGYRIFCRFRRPDGRVLRGLRILRSDADSRFLVWSGNLLTGYRYRPCSVQSRRTPESLAIDVETPSGEADLSVRAVLDPPATAPPPSSPFPDLATARRFAGPLPFTFGYEPAARRLVIVEGVRRDWSPVPVRVEVERCTFLDQPPFAGSSPRLANAFFLENVDYRWKRGRIVALDAKSA